MAAWYINVTAATLGCQHCIDSAPARSLLFFVVDSVCLYVCMSVCNALSNRFFFFVSRSNRAIFGMSFLRVVLYKTLFFEF